MTAIDVLQNRKCKMTWKFIAFKHNQHQIYDAKKLSVKLKFDEFEFEQSDRWLGNKDLMPDREFVDQYYQHQKKVLVDTNYQTSMKPNCLINGKPENQLYIDSEGDFYPCCWIGTYRYKYKHLFAPNKKHFNISNNSLDSILKQKEVINYGKAEFNQ